MTFLFMFKVDKYLQYFLCFLLVLLVVDVSWQVVTRFILPEPSSFTEELARFLLIWIGLLGAAYTYGQQMHLGLDYFSQKLRGKNKVFIELSVVFFTAVFAIIILIVGGLNLVKITLELEQTSPVMGLKMAWVYSAIPLSGVLFLLYCSELFFRRIREYRPQIKSE